MISALVWRRRLAEMRALLAADRRLLLTGAVAELAALDARRLEAERKLQDMPADVARSERRRLRELRRMARRNQRLLNAYLDGARRAAARLADIRRKSAEFGAYRQDGSRIPAPSAHSTRNMRA